MCKFSRLILVLLLLSGCGQPGPKTYPVSGTVTFDGQAIEDGYVIFHDSDNKIAPAAGPIANGKFSFSAPAGAKRVEIRASRDTGKKSPDEMGGGPVLEDYIPEKYGAQSTLTAEVVPGGQNQFEFKLEAEKSPPPPPVRKK